MTARADHHIAIRVSDLDRSIRFYTEALGARPLTAPSVREGPVIDEVFAPGARARMCFVALDAGNLELWQFLSPVAPIPASDQPRLGLMHFAVTVDSVDEVAARVVAAGGRLRFPVKRLGGRDSDAGFVYCEDPDGNVFELLDTDLPGTIRRIVAASPEAALPDTAP
jgi:catechol 2,3-dioxygenase-like lactoylglutathione lyase family enzyme